MIELKHLNAFTPTSFSPTSKSSKNTVVWKFKCWEKIRATAPVIQQQWLNPLTTPLWLSMYLHMKEQWSIWTPLSMKDDQHWHKTILNWPAPIKFQIQTKCCSGKFIAVIWVYSNPQWLGINWILAKLDFILKYEYCWLEICIRPHPTFEVVWVGFSARQKQSSWGKTPWPASYHHWSVNYLKQWLQKDLNKLLFCWFVNFPVIFWGE